VIELFSSTWSSSSRTVASSMRVGRTLTCSACRETPSWTNLHVALPVCLRVCLCCSAPYCSVLLARSII